MAENTKQIVRVDAHATSLIDHLKQGNQLSSYERRYILAQFRKLQTHNGVEHEIFQSVRQHVPYKDNYKLNENDWVDNKVGNYRETIEVPAIDLKAKKRRESIAAAKSISRICSWLAIPFALLFGAIGFITMAFVIRTIVLLMDEDFLPWHIFAYGWKALFRSIVVSIILLMVVSYLNHGNMVLNANDFLYGFLEPVQEIFPHIDFSIDLSQ